MVDVTSLNPAAVFTQRNGANENEDQRIRDDRILADEFNQQYFETNLPTASSSYSCFADRRMGFVGNLQPADDHENNESLVNICAGSSTYYFGNVPTLRFLALRRIGLALFSANVKTGDLRRARRDARFWASSIRTPLKCRRQVLEMVREILHEATKWMQQHAALFVDRQNRRGFFQEDHLKLYIHCLVWSPHNLLIDVWRTFQNVWTETSDWPMMRFRFACCYALVGELKKFTALRLKSMKDRLGDHPLYHFWYFYLQEKHAHQRLFGTDSLVPRPLVAGALQWALEHGHTHLVRFFWRYITPAQAEYVGMLKWRKMCFQVTHVPLFEWLCVQLCQVNTIAMARITWNQFYSSLFQSLNADKAGGAEEQSQLRVHMYKLRYLLTHCCGRMRWALLTLQHCQALNTLFMYRDHMLMELILEHITQAELRMVVDYFETLLKISNGERQFEDNSKYMVIDERNRNYLYKFLRVLKIRLCDDDNDDVGD